MNMKHKLLLGAAIAIAGATGFATQDAQARTVIYATVAPPALRVEHMPPPRRGYVWAPGYWAWAHHRYVWRSGHWVRGRHGYRYRAPRWVQDGNRWRYYDGGWDH